MMNDTYTTDIDLGYIKEQLNAIFSRIKIVDDSLATDEINGQLFEYYTEKFSKPVYTETKFDFIDLFCGAGGLSVGLEQEGFRPIIAVDNNKAAIMTYRFNRPWLSEKNIINEDIRTLIDQEVFPHVPLVVGGPPCQGFSVANQHKKENDERNELYRFYVHTVAQAKPQVFLMENVEGILQLYTQIEEDFLNIGYITCKPLLLNTKDFGFPQSRKRAFIVGFREEYAGMVDELYSVLVDEINSHLRGVGYSLWDAISDMPVLEAKTVKNATYLESSAWGYTAGRFVNITSTYGRLVNRGLPENLPLLNHRSKYNNPRDIEIYQTLQQGEKSDAESIQHINPYKNRADIFRDKFDKLVATDPCKAITAHMYYDCNMYIHPYQARGLSPREAARVQGFPDDYFFLGSPNEWYRQIGNAVSPLMARVLAGGLRKVLERINKV